MRWLATAGLILASVVGVASPASAHASDEYGHNTFVSLSADGVRVEMHLTAGPLVGGAVAALIDSNNDDQFSDAEINAYATQIAHDLIVSVDGKPRPLTVTSMVIPSPLAVRSGAGELVFSAIAAGAPARNRVEFVDHHRVLKGNAQASLLDSSALPSDLHIDRSVDRGIALTGRFANNNLVIQVGAPTTAGRSQRNARTLKGFLDNANTLGAMAAALGIAALLGALHALTPGHGKTIAGAYLIGENATVRHALVLGAATTITHTGSVLILGAVSIGLAGRVDTTTLANSLRWVSGLLVVGIGLLLFAKRWRGVKVGHSHERDRHDHDHDHQRDHQHDHQHDGHGLHDVLRVGAQPVGFRRLVAVGASGGLIPCPEALGVLIIAVAIHRQVFGMALILSFSLGLAAVLVAIGIVLVRARGVIDRVATLPQAITTRWLPLFSAAVVTVLGLLILTGRVV
jgi:nickel/cobalt transporter (NicO) family protein